LTSEGNPGTSTTVLHGNATGNPSFSAIVEDDITFSDNTTGNANSSRHGLLPKLSNVSTEYLNGQGNFATPSGIVSSYSTVNFTNQTSVNVIHNFGAMPLVQLIGIDNVVFLPYDITHNTINDFTVTFNASTSGKILSTVGSPQPQTFISVNSNYNVLVTDYMIKANASGINITLPTAIGNTGRLFHIKNYSTGPVYIKPFGTENIDGELTQILSLIESLSVTSDGTNYFYF
jgi:hypothetical protein